MNTRIASPKFELEIQISTLIASDDFWITSPNCHAPNRHVGRVDIIIVSEGLAHFKSTRGLPLELPESLIGFAVDALNYVIPH
jgi:hypothetical protein